MTQSAKDHQAASRLVEYTMGSLGLCVLSYLTVFISMAAWPQTPGHGLAFGIIMVQILGLGVVLAGFYIAALVYAAKGAEPNSLGNTLAVLGGLFWLLGGGYLFLMLALPEPASFAVWVYAATLLGQIALSICWFAVRPRTG